MKRNNEIRKSLGLTQEHMALLLGVSRSHLAYYELGTRDLPHKASMILSELVLHVHTRKSGAESIAKRTIDNEKRKQKIDFLLRENEYQQRVLAKKIAVAEKKHMAHGNRLGLVQSATGGQFKNVSMPPAHANYLEQISSDDVLSKSTEQLSDYHFKRQWLEHDQLFLELQLKALAD